MKIPEPNITNAVSAKGNAGAAIVIAEAPNRVRHMVVSSEKMNFVFMVVVVLVVIFGLDCVSKIISFYIALCESLHHSPGSQVPVPAF